MRTQRNRTRWPGAVPFDVRGGGRAAVRAVSASSLLDVRTPRAPARCARLRLTRPAGKSAALHRATHVRSPHVPSTLPHEQNSTTIPRPVASGLPSTPEPVAHEHPLLSVSQTDVSALAHTAHTYSAHIQRGTSRDDPVTAPGFGLRRTADNTASSDILLPAAPSSLGISHPMQHAAR